LFDGGKMRNEMFKRRFIHMLFLALIVSIGGNVIAQKREIRDPSKRPKDFLSPTRTAAYMKTKEYRIAHERLERDFWWLYEPEEKEQILSQSREAVLRNLTSDKDFWKVAKARYWCSKNAPDFIPDLIKLLENPTVVGLQGYADLIIWERIVSKDLPFYGHGWVVPDDLFSIAGRASWILSEITGQRFGKVIPSSTPEELKHLSEAWARWCHLPATKRELRCSGGLQFQISYSRPEEYPSGNGLLRAG